MRKYTSQRESTTAVGEHKSMKRHNIADEEVKALAKESNTWWRKIRETVETRTHLPKMNRDSGYGLLVIYDNIL